MALGWALPQSFLPPSARWRCCAVFVPLVCALVSPATALPVFSGPPWAIEAPDAATQPHSPRVRFGLGSESFVESQESLRIAAFDQLLEFEDLPSGHIERERLLGDPELLNRKFDL